MPGTQKKPLPGCAPNTGGIISMTYTKSPTVHTAAAANNRSPRATRLPFAALMSLAILVTGVPTGVVWAQGATELEELVVTARRREENLMETPVSIAAFSEADIRARQFERVNQIGQATPNVEFRENANAGSSNYAAVAYIRGVGQSDFIASVEPGVGIYIDEAYIGVMSGAVMNLLDIESIQILRGPQATLFGRNTRGSTIIGIP